VQLRVGKREWLGGLGNQADQTFAVRSVVR